MSIRRNPVLDVVLNELNNAGANYNIRRTNHYKIHWSVGASHGMLTVPFSPSDWRAPQNALAFLRRQLRNPHRPEAGTRIQATN
jgi:hypothetical protein